MRARNSAAPEFSLNRFGQLLAQLHAPLVKRIHAPDDALHKGLLLVKRDQCAKRFGRQRVEQNRVARTVASKEFVWRQRINFRSVQPLRTQLGVHLCLSLAEHQSFGLRDAVREQQAMMFR